jgi:hypothetical protein
MTQRRETRTMAKGRHGISNHELRHHNLNSCRHRSHGTLVENIPLRDLRPEGLKVQRSALSPFRERGDGASSHYDDVAATTSWRLDLGLHHSWTSALLFTRRPNLATVAAQEGQTTTIATSQQGGGSRVPIHTGHRPTILVLSC